MSGKYSYIYFIIAHDHWPEVKSNLVLVSQLYMILLPLGTATKPVIRSAGDLTPTFIKFFLYLGSPMVQHGFIPENFPIPFWRLTQPLTFPTLPYFNTSRCIFFLISPIYWTLLQTELNYIFTKTLPNYYNDVANIHHLCPYLRSFLT